jgi:hypothetical protein
VFILDGLKLFRINTSTSVDSKEVTEVICLQESNRVAGEDFEGVRRTAWRTRMVAEFQRGCYHNSTVPVKEYLEMIGGAGVRGGKTEQ